MALAPKPPPARAPRPANAAAPPGFLPWPAQRPPTERDLERWIVHRDEGFFVVHKPAGVLSQGGEGGAGVNLVDLARALLGRSAHVGVVHRLDRNVSGLVLLTHDPRAGRALATALQRGRVLREYLGVARGAPREPAFAIHALLAKDERSNEVRALDADAVAALAPDERAAFREAHTEVSLVASLRAPLGALSVLALRPITGRSHQLRAHLAFVGLPLVGDPKYGVGAQGLARPLLHATRMVFPHPRTGAAVEVTAAPPWTEASLRALRAAARR